MRRRKIKEIGGSSRKMHTRSNMDIPKLYAMPKDKEEVLKCQ